MFSQLFFIILLLIILNISGEAPPIENHEEWMVTLLSSTTLYIIVLALIAIQNIFFAKKKNPSVLLFLSNIELCTCLLFLATDLHPLHTSSLFLTTAFYLFLYFLGLAFHHLLSHKEPGETPIHYSLRQMRFFLPFVVPFLLFNALYDLAHYLHIPFLEHLLQGSANTASEFFSLLASTFCILFLLLAFFPPLLIRLWGCSDIPEGELRTRLIKICNKANFSYGGMKIWNVMKDAYTAAIIGVLPKFRFVLFTKNLLKSCPPDYVEAVLSHEIGHSYYKHLLIYPFIILGMMFFTGTLSLLFGEPYIEHIMLKKALAEGGLWGTLEPLLLFVPYALILFIYFRFIFGFFSRNFERQADLHGFRLGIPAAHMIGALDYIGVITGNSHKKPSWHHHSIFQRMHFLKQAEKTPSLVEKHHKRVKKLLKIYACCLLLTSCILFSPYLKNTPFFSTIYKVVSSVSSSIDTFFNHSTRKELVSKYQEKLLLPGDETLITQSLLQSLSHPGALSTDGILPFYLAQHLFINKQYKASLLMMTRAWKEFDFSQYSPSFYAKFALVSRNILEESNRSETKEEREQLLNTIEETKARLSMEKILPLDYNDTSFAQESFPEELQIRMIL